MLVSEVMLQQTPVARVVPAYLAWLARWPGPVELAAEPAGEAIRQWGRLGYPRRAVRLHAADRILTTRHDAAVPADLGALLALPGVGTYTARAVASFAFGQRHAVVDTNVRRVLARVFRGVATAPVSRVADDLRLAATLLPEQPDLASRFSVGLMELGALVCTARSPRCTRCPLLDGCRWAASGRPASGGRRGHGQPYAGTDRQARGELLAALRSAPDPVEEAALRARWPDAAQAERALASMVADGLTVRHPAGRVGLP